MTDEFFTIGVDVRRSLIHLQLYGIWDVPTVDRYAAAAQAAFAKVAEGAARDGCKVLIDLRRHGVQPREVAERIGAWLTKAASEEARYAVLVSDSSVHKMQAQRLGSLLSAQVFSDEGEARAWLTDDRSPAPVRSLETVSPATAPQVAQG